MDAVQRFVGWVRQNPIKAVIGGVVLFPCVLCTGMGLIGAVIGAVSGDKPKPAVSRPSTATSVQAPPSASPPAPVAATPKAVPPQNMLPARMGEFVLRSYHLGRGPDLPVASARYDLGTQPRAVELLVQWGEDMEPLKLESSRPFKVKGHEGQLNENGNVYEQAAVRWRAQGWDFTVKLPPGNAWPQKRAVALVTQAAEDTSAWADQFLPGGQPPEAAKLAEHRALLDTAARQHDKDLK